MADYFDLTIDGLGYVNGIALKTNNDGQDPFWVCQIAALRGSTDNAKYTYFECVVVGKKAISLIERLQDASDAKQKILMGFELRDLTAVPFIFNQGQHKGQPGAHLNAKLLRIHWIKIAGVDVYRAKPKQLADNQAHQHTVAESIPEAAE